MHSHTLSDSHLRYIVIALLILSLFFLMGCTVTREVTLDSVQLLNEINEQGQTKPAHVTFQNGQKLTVRSFIINQDLASGRVEGESFEWASVSIRTIRFNPSGKSALTGAGIGFGAGVLIGLLAAAGDSGSSNNSGGWSVGPSFDAGAVALVLGAMGAIPGLLIGMSAEEPVRYRFIR